MIERDEMMIPMLNACPSFEPMWVGFLNEWRGQGEVPVYIALGGLARHLVATLANGDIATLSAVFKVVERWLLEGSHYVREAASLRLLENLQNESLHETTRPEDFERFLMPESLKWWRNVERFWRRGRRDS